MKLSVVVPVYNERLYLPATFLRLHETLKAQRRIIGLEALELLVVNDGSDDGSGGWLRTYRDRFQSLDFADLGRRAEFKLLDFTQNQGKGSAIREALTQSSGDVVLIHDSDLEYDARDIPRLLEPLLEGRADAVIGSRFLGAKRRVIFFWHSIANRLLNGMFNFLMNTTHTDLMSGAKAIRGDLARMLRLKSRGFEIEVELCARLASAQVRLYEVGINYDGRKYEDGKKITPWDGLLQFYFALRFSLFGGTPLLPGMRQTLTALQDNADAFYRVPLQQALTTLREELGPIRRVLEIGAGYGSITHSLLRFDEVVATDIDPQAIETLRRRFAFAEGFEAARWDAGSSLDSTETPSSVRAGNFDLIVAFNVLEHIENHEQALATWARLLRPNGCLMVLVPFSQRLYSPIDRAVGHYRRYSRSDLEQLLQKKGGDLLQTRFLNPLGILGWVLNGILLQRAELPSGQVRLYGWLKPLLRPLEKLLERRVGLSVISVARWPGQS